MKVILFLLIIIAGLVWWFGLPRLARLLGIPNSWMSVQAKVIFFTIIFVALVVISLLPYL